MTNPDENATSPEPTDDDGPPEEVPPARPAYSTPPTEGLPDAEHG